MHVLHADREQCMVNANNAKFFASRANDEYAAKWRAVMAANVRDARALNRLIVRHWQALRAKGWGNG